MSLSIGSPEHKEAFCRSFVETHDPFRPEEIVWPELDAEGLARLKSLPVWEEAVRTEGATALIVQRAAEVESDPVLREAIALQGYEEARHASILRLLTSHYGIRVEPGAQGRPAKNPAWAFLRTGYGECLDSFFAFGLFRIGQQSQYFPDALLSIFERVMQEEARHILFIVNWAAYLRARSPFLLRPAFDLRRSWCIFSQLLGHARNAASFGKSDSQEGFTMAAHSSFGDFTLRSFFELCLAENERRLAPYDARLLRPRLVPWTVRAALRVLRRRKSGHPIEAA
jgi:hypothetical protein